MTTIYLKTRPVKRSRNLRGILDYARVSPVVSVDCQRVVREPLTGGLPVYSVTFIFDNGAIGESDWQDWRVLVQWIKARRSWDVQAFTGLIEFTHAMTRTDPPPAPVWGLMAAYRPYACQCCGTVQQIQTNHTGPLSGVCGGCNRRGLDLPTTGHAPYGGRFPRALAYAGGPIQSHEYNPHAEARLPFDKD